MEIRMTYDGNEHGLQYSPLAVLMLSDLFNKAGLDVSIELDRISPHYNCSPASSLIDPQFSEAIKVAQKLNGIESFLEVLNTVQVDYSCDEHSDVKAVLTSFGCKRNCKYCPDYKHSLFHVREVDIVVDEIRQLYSLGHRYFEFVDNNVTNDLDHFLSIIKHIPKGMQWGALINLDNKITDDVLNTFMLHGCDRLYTGLESMNPKSQKAYGKNFDGVDVEWMLQTINNSVPLNAFIIKGLPFETEESWLNMLNFLNAHDICYNINYLREYDGSLSTKMHSTHEAERLARQCEIHSSHTLYMFLREHLTVQL